MAGGRMGPAGHSHLSTVECFDFWTGLDGRYHAVRLCSVVDHFTLWFFMRVPMPAGADSPVVPFGPRVPSAILRFSGKHATSGPIANIILLRFVLYPPLSALFDWLGI